MSRRIRTYSELITLPTFKERYEYLRVGARIGDASFGFERSFNQEFYRSAAWKRIRRNVIIRDNGCDLGIDGMEIGYKIIIHHMNPITLEDLEHESDLVTNMEYLICCSDNTHRAIHYGDENLLQAASFAVRTPNDTCPWR